MAAEGQLPTASEYIVHHLQHLQKDFSFNSAKQTSIVDFSVFNLDSIVVSTFLGIVAVLFLWGGARRASAGVPGRYQAFVEMLVEMVDTQAKSVIHNAASRRFVAPLAVMVFVWIFLMNFMDVVPVDLIPHMWASGVHEVFGMKDYMRVVAPADLSTTLGMSTFILLLCIYYNIKIKGLGGWGHELISAPFGARWYLAPFNLLMQIIEFIAKTVSHGMRLFGNLFAGELVFMLIALMGGAFAISVLGFGLAIGHVIAGVIWTLFHILVIVLQAFIFMMLTLIYIGQAHDAH
jgi:F-type H+-transporting ATPase subunit a